ncbi:type II/IV secretion system ATPase subunit [Candidatus Woesearchaeota archaeon]|nr:type II/IV secretion system ATPase subunit [Candidatus Woesearchaeota archaeon]
MPACGEYEVVREGEEATVRILCDECPFFPSLEDDPQVFSMIMKVLLEVGPVSRLILVQKRDYEYTYEQTQLLVQLARKVKDIMGMRIGSGLISSQEAMRYLSQRYSMLQNIIQQGLKSDPIGAFLDLQSLIESDESFLSSGIVQGKHYVERFLDTLKLLQHELLQLQLIQQSLPHLKGLMVGDRSIYRRLFSPIIRPDFMFTKLMASYPVEGEELETYTFNGNEVTIFKSPSSVQYLYHVIPPEFTLTEDRYELLDSARKILAEHQPKKSEFVDPKRIRDVFWNVSMDLLDELASYKGIQLRLKEKEQLANILVRYTVGFGLIEVLLEDDKIQDISVNSPMGKTPIFIVHQDYGDCTTNIIPTLPESESWASKLRLISGRPLDEANPILDTELELPNARARVAAVNAPLNPSGLAYSFRRHRDKPWTLELFIKNGMMNSLGAGLLSFLIDGARTMLIAGTRSSGKSSLLGSLMVEIMRRIRIIVIEDTLELPSSSLKDLGYNIQSLKVASALTKGTTEVSADEGIRTTLRLGDSSLIVGEVRSVEAIALYEAMRVGALANTVAGTIHGDSPYGVFDRVVNDLRVPRTSFKATDIIVVANPIRSPDGLHRWRRITRITEVRKHWEDDPVAEGGFVDLMKYNAETDTLEPTQELINGDSEMIKAIGANVKEWAGNWDAIWENILLRAKIKDTIVKTSKRVGDPKILEAEFVIKSNDAHHNISERVRDEDGYLNTDRIFSEWSDWLERELNGRSGVKV